MGRILIGYIVTTDFKNWHEVDSMNEIGITALTWNSYAVPFLDGEIESDYYLAYLTLQEKNIVGIARTTSEIESQIKSESYILHTRKERKVCIKKFISDFAAVDSFKSWLS